MNFEELLTIVRKDFREMLGVTGYGVLLDPKEKESRIRSRENLRTALRACGSGDLKAKRFVLDHISELLVKKYEITEAELDRLLAIRDEAEMFHYMLYQYMRRFKENCFTKLVSDYALVSDGEISRESVRKAMRVFPYTVMNYPEKLEYLALRLYENYKGNGAADILFEAELDGISGGVSGDPVCVWVMHKGCNIKLPFLVLDTARELPRIVRNLCRASHMGTINEKKGYMVTEMKDGSRVAVARPPLSESWVFFVRKFREKNRVGIDEIVKGEGAGEVICLLGRLVRAGKVMAVTGEMGSGKTTLLAALIEYIPERFNIRVTEMSFELHLRSRYPSRNIVSFRETETVTVQDALDFAKKTDGTVTIMGEAASMESVSLLIQLTQTASAYTLFTHHAKTTEKLIEYLRNSLLMKGGFSNERVALAQAVAAVEIDVHMGRKPSGERYIERITEIEQTDDEKGYKLNCLVKYENGRYVMKDRMSDGMISTIRESLGAAEDAFIGELRRWWGRNRKNYI